MPSDIIRFFSKIFFCTNYLPFTLIPDFKFPSEKTFFSEFMLVFSEFYFRMFLWQNWNYKCSNMTFTVVPILLTVFVVVLRGVKRENLEAWISALYWNSRDQIKIPVQTTFVGLKKILRKIGGVNVCVWNSSELFTKFIYKSAYEQ